MAEITVSVRRSAVQAADPARFETFKVELGAHASVLDALFAVQRGKCPDLAFRFSCRVGMCGSCAMVVNGREQLACSTLVNTIGNSLRIEPLRNLPVARDLAVDLKPFFDAYRKVEPAFEPRDGLDANEFYCLPQSGPEWRHMERQPQCIDCGACFSACTLVSLNSNYLGPMALHRALDLIVDPRDKHRERRLDIIAHESGAFRCHTLGNCRDVCPRGISPTHSIARLKRLAAVSIFRQAFDRIFGGARKQAAGGTGATHA